MQQVEFDKVVRPPYSKGAIIRNDFPGFREDYLTVHSLIRRYEPKTIMEIGTSTGLGTNVVCNAMGFKRFRKNKEGKKVFSIDVPPGTNPKIIYPDGEDGHPKKAGKYCKLPYTQVYGSSLNFDFSPYYPIEAWFIDGKHDYTYTKNDAELALKSDPMLIMWHDVDIQGVSDAIIAVMGAHTAYALFRVLGTRVAYAVKS